MAYIDHMRVLLLLTCLVILSNSSPVPTDELGEAIHEPERTNERNLDNPIESLIADLKKLQNYIRYQAMLLRILVGAFGKGVLDTTENQPAELTTPRVKSSERVENKYKIELQQLVDLAKKHTRNPPGKRVQEPMLEPRAEKYEVEPNVQRKSEGQGEEFGVKREDVGVQEEELGLSDAPNGQHHDKSDKDNQKDDIILLVTSVDNQLKSQPKASLAHEQLADEKSEPMKPNNSELQSMINFLENYVQKNSGAA